MRFVLALLAVLILAQCASAQNVTVIGPITAGNCPQFSSNTVIKDGGFSCNGAPAIPLANPTGAVGLTGVNGAATTALRSDASPPLSASVQSALTGTINQVLTGTGAFGFSSITNPQLAALITPGSVVTGFGTRALAIAATIPAAITTVVLQGYTTANDGGGGTYTKLASPPAPAKAWHFQSTDGAWWQLVTSPVVPKQVGAKLDGSTDDSTAMQAWLDYGSMFSVISAGQSGTTVIPTATLNLTDNEIVDGLNELTIQRTSNVVGSLVDCNTHNNIIVRNTKFTTTAGFSSTSSNTIGLTSQTYTVPSGLNLVVNNFVQITANTSTAAHVNYEIAQITAYSGTTLTVTATTVVGSGTFAAWLIDVYPITGDLAASNIALRFTTCNNILASGNTFSNRFYNSLDSRNGNDVIFTQNIISGHVNRGIHAASYLSANASSNNQVTFNRIDGQSISQYGINSSATDTALGIGFLIHGNRIVNTTFQGIIIGGGITFSEISNNSVQMAFNNNGAGILVEQLTGTGGNQQPQNISVNHNTIDLGGDGIFIDNTTYSSFTGNSISLAGVGIFVNGPTATSNAYNTISGNIMQACVSNGFQTSSGVSGGVTGLSVTGNTFIGNGGTGFLSDANSSNFVVAGNVALANTTAQYNIGGTGHVSANLNK